MAKKVFRRPRKSDKLQGITVSEFARREGCTSASVYGAIRTGKLKRNSDGTLDPSLLGTWIKRKNRLIGPPAETTRIEIEVDDPADDEIEEESIEALLKMDPTKMSLAQAERLDKVYVAIERKRKHEENMKMVAPIDVMRRLVLEEYATIKTRFLSFSSNHAPKIARLNSDPALIEDYLSRAINKVLSELSDEEDFANG